MSTKNIGSSESLFVLARPPGFTFSHIPPAFDPSKVPPEKNPNCASQVVKALTLNIISTFQKCNPHFKYDPIDNPKRCLTIPAEGVNNDGYDNVNNEYILYVNDVIRSPENEEYVIIELVGKGTFGQVIRCIKKSSQTPAKEYAVKVIKNKPAYTNQALTEVKIYKKLKEENSKNEDRIVRLYDYFVFRNHICLIFELLHISLYDLLRLSNFSGFSLKFIGRLAEQILESLICLERNKIIHCDLKPENVLFADEESDAIKVIDLGSSCFLHNTLYTYIQSRFYRAPEVILGAKYSNKIDSWSLGCMVAEFYLGLPIFPGNSEYDQIKRIIEILGMFEDSFVEEGRFKKKFFKKESETYAFKTVEEFELEEKVKLQPHKKYFILKKLEDLEMYYNKSKQREKQPGEKARFECFIHFLKGLLHTNPIKRWTASQARHHPFLTGKEFSPEWQPMSPSEALEASVAFIPKAEEGSVHKTPPTSFNNMATEGFTNAESFRPYLPPNSMDKKEEVMSHSQNVYLLNSQTSSNKPKSKLNPKAAMFNAANIDTQMANANAAKQGSRSEPNSARGTYSKQRKDSNDVIFTYQEEKEEDNVEGQPVVYPEQQDQQVPEKESDKNFKKHQNQNQQQHKGGYRDANNVSQNQQFYPSGGQYYYGQNQGGYQPRQRSNSDQGASENIYFQKNKGNQYHPQQHHQQQYNNSYVPYNQQNQYNQQIQYNQQNQQYIQNNQFIPYNPYNQAPFQPMGQPEQISTTMQNQGGHTRQQGQKWSGNSSKGSGYKNKYGNKNNQQHDEKEELKEK